MRKYTLPIFFFTLLVLLVLIPLVSPQGTPPPLIVVQSVYATDYSTETWYMRSDTHTVNKQLGYVLNTTGTTTSKNVSLSTTESAMMFDGNGAYSRIEDSVSLNNSGAGFSAFTLEAWLKINAFAPDKYVISKDVYGSAAPGDASLISVDNNYGYVNGLVFVDQYTPVYLGQSNLLTDTWYYVVARLNATHLSLWINATEAEAKAAGNPLWNNNHTLLFGTQEYGVWYSFNGTIDEVKVSSRAISWAEMNAHYNAGVGRYLSVDPYTVGLWHLDEASGNQTLDISGNGNHGTLHNNYAWVTGKIQVPAYWAVRIFKVISTGTSTEMTNTYNLNTSRTVNGQGLQTLSWTPSVTALEPSLHAICVKVYMKFGADSYSLKAIFITSRLETSEINNSTWSIKLYTNKTGTNAYFFWGHKTSYPSRIENIELSELNAWEDMRQHLTSGDLVGFFMSPWTHLIGDLIYGIGVMFLAITSYNRYRSVKPIILLFWIFGGVGGFLTLMIPGVGLEISYVFLGLALATTLWVLIK